MHLSQRLVHVIDGFGRAGRNRRHRNARLPVPGGSGRRLQHRSLRWPACAGLRKLISGWVGSMVAAGGWKGRFCIRWYRQRIRQYTLRGMLWVSLTAVFLFGRVVHLPIILENH